MKKIMLCNPPADENYRDPHVHHYVPPLGLMALKTYLKSKLNLEFLFVDGDLEGYEKIERELKRFKPDFFGTSDLLVSHINGLKLLSLAKNLGSTTIIGGHNATHLAREIIYNNSFLDFVVMGDGEKALEEIVRGNDPHYIKNLAFRDNNGQVQLNERENLPISFFLPLRYDGVDLSAYEMSLKNTQTDINIHIKISFFFCLSNYNIRIFYILFDYSRT